MARFQRFAFLCDPSERRAIADLAKRLQRSQSDAVRFVVIEAARQLNRTALMPDTRSSAGDPAYQEGRSHVTC